MKNYKEFTQQNSEFLEELNATFSEYRHTQSGACILHIQNDDPENLFCLSFKTIPPSSNGVAHILEHTVLCGSKKFPVKDPFFSMIRRSLNTYMNALTGSDFTCYPAASLVEKDFYNLLEVYLDAVFHPNLNHLSFLQEGHRKEFEDFQDSSSPLQFKGIVFNEMKGSLASLDTRAWKEMMQALYPTLPYRFNSGGNPEDILNLSYEELLAFHNTYYHPSKCLFYFYGNLPIEKHLDFLSEHAFKGIECSGLLPEIKEEKRFQSIQKVSRFYPFAQEKKLDESVLNAIGVLSSKISEQEELLALQLIDQVLMGSDASPLKEALLKSKLQKTVDCYMDTDCTEVPIIFFYKGCKKDSIDLIYKKWKEELQKIVLQGIDENLIEAAIHQMEFSRTEIIGGHSPFGLTLFMRSALLKQHGVDPKKGLTIHALFAELRKRCLDKHYLPSLIEKYFLNNQHTVLLEMIPNKHLSQEEKDKEEDCLKKIKASLSEDEVKDIIAISNSLQQLQETNEPNLECLPKVSSLDVLPTSRELALKYYQDMGLKIYTHTCFTNHILYAEVHYSIPSLNIEELTYLRLFAALLTEVGSTTKNYKENLQYLQSYTGGMHAFLSLHTQSDDFNCLKPTLGLKGKALYRNASKLFTYFKDQTQEVDFSDEERLKELLDQHLSSLENNLVQSALKYASTLSSQSFSLPAFIASKVYGIDYLHSLRDIVKKYYKDPKPLKAILNGLKEKLFSFKPTYLVITADEKMLQDLKNHHYYDFYNPSQKEQKTSFSLSFVPEDVGHISKIIASPVAFNALSLPSPAFQDEDAPLLNIAAHIFENKSIHKRVREQGGAYGSGASPHSSSGHFTFYSLRDPNIYATIEAFFESVNIIVQDQFEDKDIEEAKLQILQDLDAPIPPSQRGSTAFAWMMAGKTQKVRDKYRQALLNASKEGIQNAVSKHIKKNFTKMRLASLANQTLLEKEIPKLRSLGIETMTMDNL